MIVFSDYVPPPTTTSKPTTAADMAEIDGSMDCTCQPNMTGMAEAINGQTASGRAIRYLKKEEEGQLFLRPVPLARGGGGYHGHYHGHYGVSSGGSSSLVSTLLVAVLGAFLGATLSSLIPVVIGGSLTVEDEEERERREELVMILTKIQDTLKGHRYFGGLQRSLDRGGSGLFGGLRDAIFQAVINALVAQVLAGIGLGRSAHSPKDRQLLNDLLSGNAGNGASDMVNQMAMDMAQQQLEEMLASGQMQEQVQQMMMEMVESGQLEQMLVEILQSPEVEQMVDELMAEIMRPPTEEEQALMQELMRPPTKEEMAQLQEVWTEVMSAMMSEEEFAKLQQSFADWGANGGMMGAMIEMNGGMAELMGSMEMKMHCKCAMVPDLAGPSSRGLKRGGD